MMKARQVVVAIASVAVLVSGCGGGGLDAEGQSFVSAAKKNSRTGWLWPSDSTLVSDGKSVCRDLDRNGGSWDALIDYGGVEYLAKYNRTQRQDVVGAATDVFCYKHSTGALFDNPYR